MEGLSLGSPRTTHTGPANDEIATVEDYLSSGRRKLSTLNVAIAKLQSTLADLKLQRDTLNTQLDSYRSLIAPIRRLLPEILREIFRRCLPTAHNAIMSRREVPLLLCCVCRRWRQIALSTPQLWASIHVVIPDDVQPYPIPHVSHSQLNASLLSSISRWVSHSGALPLSISVSFPRGPVYIPGPPTHLHMIQPYLDVLALYKSRWRSVHLPFLDFGWTATLSQFSAYDLPMLENIYISGPLPLFADDSGYAAPRELIPLAKDSRILLAPSLRSIAIPFGHRSSSLPLPIRWENLTRLEIVRASCGYNLRDVAKTLLLCPKLETFSISFSAAYLEAGSGLPQVNLPNLYSISFVGGNGNQTIFELFKSLHTPQLRHLAYEQDATWNQVDGVARLPSVPFLTSLSIFLDRLTRPLEELSLEVEFVPDVEVVHILRLVPELKRLSLRHFSKSWGGGGERRSDNSLVPPDSAGGAMFYFSDAHLASLTPRKASLQVWGEETGDHEIADGDESSMGGSGDCSRGLLLSLDAKSLVCACPKLEVFHCVGGAFSDTVILDFLHSRFYHPNYETAWEGNSGVARLRKASIVNYLPSGERGSKETRKRIEELRAVNPFSVLSVAFVPTLEPPPIDRNLPMLCSLYEGVDQFDTGWR